MKEIPVAHVALQYYYGQLHEERELDFENFLKLLNDFIALNEKDINEKSLNEPDFLLKTDGFKLPENEGNIFLETFKKLFIESQEVVIDYVLRYIEFGIHKNHSFYSNEYNIPNQRRSMYSHGPVDYNKR